MLLTARAAIMMIAMLFITFASRQGHASPSLYGHDYSSDDCDVGHGDVCSWSAITKRWTCDASSITGSSAYSATIVAAYDHSTGGDLCDGDDFCAFGESNGTYFYCPFTDANIAEVFVLGADNNDDLLFHHTQDSVTYELREPGVTLVHGEIQGGDGSDWISGSSRDSSKYTETLRGDGGNDQTIYGNGGDDYLYGGSGDDLMQGGSGDDHMYGGSGNDDMQGNLGDDTMYGDDDNDTMNGNGGKDVMYGGKGVDAMAGSGGQDLMYGGADGDFICGDEEGDTLNGAAGDDEMAGGDGTDSGDGGPGSDSCDYAATSTYTNCEDPLPDPPDECPTSTGDL